MFAKLGIIPKETRFHSSFRPCRSLNVTASEDEQGSAKENAELLCGFVYGGLVRTHEHPSEAIPLRRPEDVANSRIAEADTRNLTEISKLRVTIASL